MKTLIYCTIFRISHQFRRNNLENAFENIFKKPERSSEAFRLEVANSLKSINWLVEYVHRLNQKYLTLRFLRLLPSLKSNVGTFVVAK